MRRACWYHCGQILACAAVAFLLAAHEKLCTLPVVPARTPSGQPQSDPDHARKPRRKPPTLTERTPDWLLPRRSAHAPVPVRVREWTQGHPDGSAGPPAQQAAGVGPRWRLLAQQRPLRIALPKPIPRSDRQRIRMFSHLIARHGPPAV